AVAAVAARRAAARDELLAAERHRAGAAVAGLHENLRFVDELHGVPAACRSTAARALRLGLRLGGLDVHVDAIAASLLVLHGALDDRVEREIATHLDAASRMHPATDLADEDVPRHDGLPAEHLDAPVLPRRVSPVARGALTFFVRHCCASFSSRCP